MFDEWLSPDVMDVLIRGYAKPAPGGEPLSWEYSKLPDRTWGQFVASRRTLYVNQAKTKNQFKQQVETILHEIQHWNQLVDELVSGGDVSSYNDAYRQEKAARGYWKNRYEVDARAFSEAKLDEAMLKLSKHYGGKIEGGSFDLAMDELFDEFADEAFITRIQIGMALKAHDANTPDNMKKAVATLTDLGMKVR